MNEVIKRAVLASAIGVASVGLSGCIVAAVPLIMAAGAAGAAVTGFVVYKSVQTTGGGSVRIAFGSSDSKHPSPPQALPRQMSLGVAGSGERERKFTSVVRDSGKFQVALAEGSSPPRTRDEWTKTYENACQRLHASIVVASLDEGQTVSSNMLSFKRGAATQKLSLEGYGCASHAVVWADTMAVVVESGHKSTPQVEIDDIAGRAWAERVLLASTLS